MAIKLGELLVREGLVTEEDLEEALKYQVIYGGKLGTNLIEMGLVEEGEIAKALSRKLDVPYVPPQKLQNLPRNLLDIIPTEIAGKYNALPVDRENKKLYLAMADPSDLHAIDEIAFRTGYIIRPVLTPEIRLLFALEQYYGIERERRYVPLDKRVTTVRRKTRKSPPAAEPKPPQPPAEEEEFIEIPGIDAASEETAETEPAGEAHDPAATAEVVEEVAEADIVEEEYTLDIISRLLADADDREDIADIIIGYLGQEFDRGALFQVRGANISGWRGMVNGTNSEGFAQIEVGLDEPSVLKTVVESHGSYLGAISRNEANERVFRGLGCNLPPTGLLVPIQILGRVVGILYVDGESADLSERTIDLQKLAAKASMAFEILILKKKILML